MNYSKSHDWYQVSEITGPTHNLLRLEFYPTGQHGSVRVELLKFQNESHIEPLNQERVVEVVLAAVLQAQLDVPIRREVKVIGYVPSDSGPETRYERLAHALMHQLLNDLPFKEAMSLQAPPG